MKSTDAIQGELWEDSTGYVMARITGLEGAVITQASVSAIARKIFNIDGATPAIPIDESAPAVASTIYDTLQTDAAWTKDGTGYNFKDEIAATIPITGGNRYVVEYKLTYLLGEIGHVVCELLANDLWGS